VVGAVGAKLIAWAQMGRKSELESKLLAPLLPHGSDGQRNSNILLASVLYTTLISIHYSTLFSHLCVVSDVVIVHEMRKFRRQKHAP